MSCAAENPNRRLRLAALGDRVATPVDRASFDDLVTIVTSSPMWEKDRVAGIRVLLRALADGKADAPEQIVERWTWKLARATRKVQDRRASAELPDAKRLLDRPQPPVELAQPDHTSVSGSLAPRSPDSRYSAPKPAFQSAKRPATMASRISAIRRW